MSKLKELINELCPNGVEYKKIEEFCLKINNVNWSKDNNTYKYIDLSSVNIERNIITETSKVNKENAPSRAKQFVKENDVLFGTTRPLQKRLYYVEFKYDNSICSTGYCVLRTKEELSSKYLY